MNRAGRSIKQGEGQSRPEEKPRYPQGGIKDGRGGAAPASDHQVDSSEGRRPQDDVEAHGQGEVLQARFLSHQAAPHFYTHDQATGVRNALRGARCVAIFGYFYLVCSEWLTICAFAELPLLFHDFYDCVYIDEKWFFIDLERKQFYITKNEQAPRRSYQRKRHLLKVMFLVAVARQRVDHKKNSGLPARSACGCLPRQRQLGGRQSRASRAP